MLWSRSPFGVSAGSSPAPVSRVGRSSASKLRSSEHSFLLRATTAHRALRHDRSRRSAAAVGQHPSLSGAPRERCPLAPRNAAYRAAGPLGCAGRSATRLRVVPAPPPASLPGAPGLADGQGSWRGPDPARNEGKPNMTKQTNHKPGATAAASAIAPDAYARITNRIVADLEQGVRPWCKPWSGDQLGARITRPRRANGKPYAGINTLILWLEAVEKGHRSPTWMTYRQAQELGGQDRTGEGGSQVVYMGETTKTRRDEGTGEKTEQGVRFLKTYIVFNVGQIDSLPDAFAIPT